MKNTAVSAICLLLLSGCVSPMQRTESIVGKNQPLAYKKGFSHGCTSGEKAAGYSLGRYQKAVQEYANDQLYRTGWDDGYTHCMEEHKAFLRLTR
jgi:uncharacterized protein YceK